MESKPSAGHPPARPPPYVAVGGRFGARRHAADFMRARGRPIILGQPLIAQPAMEAVSLHNVNGSAPAMLDHGPQAPLKKAVGQDEASALALLTALPAPALATTGMLGTRLDAWA